MANVNACADDDLMSTLIGALTKISKNSWGETATRCLSNA
ncbi:hypothetical protein GCHA_2003 [Paraglaciecola chathamensis S18K6]|uniref:Uncharacterized protein n=1 Tax=Paraglaciecola chathamensis S18K6 TaxID=1127672 RepID=A0AAV3UXH7_9ALTE|nr:hypothetical protein GCHA_2003 [Paraglaciecola chathamensis S18K6]